MLDVPESICFHLNQSHQLISWNVPFETVAGLTNCSPGQVRLSDVIALQDLSAVEGALDRLDENTRSTAACHLTGSDGQRLLYAFTFTPLRSRNGLRICATGEVIGDSHPVTTIPWNGETFRRIFTHSNDGIIVYDLDQDLIVEANPRACRMLEYEREELLEMSITDIIPRGLQPAHEGVGEMICEMNSGRRFPAELSVSSVQRGERNYLIALLRDVRERKRVEQAEKNLERLASFPELNRDPIVELNPEGILTYYNPAAAKQFPVLNEISTVEDKEPAAHPLVSCLQGIMRTLEAQSVDRLVRELTARRSIYEVHISRIPTHGLIRIYFHDVTERKKAEAEVVELKSFYQNVLGDLPTEIAVFDNNGRYMYLNRAAVSNHHLREWLIGRTSVDYARRRGLETDLFQERHRWLQATIEAKETREREEVMIDDQGNRRYKLRIVTPVVDADGHVKYALGYGVDLTEQREATEALRREKEFTEEILNSLDDVFFAFDEDGKLLRYNHHATRLTGYPEEEIAEMLPHEFVAEDERMHLYRQLIRARREGDVAFETRLRTKSGDILPFEVIGSYLEWNDRIIMSGIGRDVTERKEHERELIRAKERAEEMSRLKSSFLANMSHEIRTPLTAILGFADILEDEMPSAENEFVSLIQQSGIRLLHTLDSVLDLAQLEAGSKTITPQSVDLVKQINEPIQMFKPQAERKGLDLNLEAPDEPVVVSVDPAGLVRIVTNLISNGIKFTESGGITVRIRPNGNAVNIDVEDTGRGIDESFQEHLFEAFIQESTGLDRSHDGTGLGLTIVKQLTELMNGSIWVNSEKGEGSTFTVRLPR
jgi:PAS domain S-box-containing protein